jgi:hypothetical protein
MNIDPGLLSEDSEDEIQKDIVKKMERERIVSEQLERLRKLSNPGSIDYATIDGLIKKYPNKRVKFRRAQEDQLIAFDLVSELDAPERYDVCQFAHSTRF